MNAIERLSFVVSLCVAMAVIVDRAYGREIDPLGQQQDVVYVYDDLNRLVRVIDTRSQACALYEYDAVGNITSITRQTTTCVSPPTFTGIAPDATPSCYIVSGEHLIGATVAVDTPGVFVSGLRTTDSSVRFCLSTRAPVCSLAAHVTVATPGGASAPMPVTVSGGLSLTAGLPMIAALGAAGETDRFCLTVPAPTWVGLQAESSAIGPCLAVSADGGGAVPGGAVCASPAARLVLNLGAGTYGIEVSDNGGNDTGLYTLRYDPVNVTVEATDAEAAEAGQQTGAFRFTRSGPAINALVVNFTRAGTATNGADYANIGTSVTIPAGQPSATVIVTPLFDGDREEPETVSLSVAPGSYNIGSPASATVTIADNAGQTDVLVNGADHTAAIATPGETDLWTFTAAAGDAIALSLGEIGGDSNLVPWLRLRGPNGVEIASDSGGVAARLNVIAAAAGTYRVIVASADLGNNDVAPYRITLAQTPKAFIVSPGDQGGALVNGDNHTGTIPVGDIDLWTFTAAAGETITLSLGEIGGDSNYQPWLRLRAPDGSELASDSAGVLARIERTVAIAGTYTVLVANANALFTDGSYRLTFVRSPGAFIVPSGDEGGPLTNGANHTGTIPVGDIDLWTFTAAAGSAITLNLAEPAGDSNYQPWIRLRAPDGSEVASDTSGVLARIDTTLKVGGTYTVLVSNFNVLFTGGAYRLTFTQTPGAFVVPSGDEGGPLTNGANHAGSIPVGDVDLWTFTAAAGDAITLSLGESGGDSNYQPWLRLRAPDGTELATDVAGVLARIDRTIAVPGLYTVMVANANVLNTGGAYRLTFVRTPGTFVVPTDDEGGPLTNGVSHTGSIPVGDVDLWTFTAAAGDAITLSLGESGGDSNYQPWLRLRAPDGTQIASQTGGVLARVDLVAQVAGTYTVAVANLNVLFVSGTYRLTLAQTPGAFTVSPDDEGGALTNGATHTGSIPVGDVDLWTFTAAAGDAIALSVGEVGGDSNYEPWLRLRAPDGSEIGNVSGGVLARLDRIAAVAGTYTVLMANANLLNTGGAYRLTLVRTPGGLVVSPGDQGGAIGAGVPQSGTIDVGDVDAWTFTAAPGDLVTLTATEPGGDTNFQPWIRLRAPDGTLLGSASGGTQAQLQHPVTVAGTYTVLVASFFTGINVGAYQLSLTQTSGLSAP